MVIRIANVSVEEFYERREEQRTERVTQMSEYNEQVMKLVKVVRDKKFLFPKTMPNRLKFGPYFEWFESHNKTEFNQMPAMVHLNPSPRGQPS